MTQVYLSSTYQDLKEYREAVYRALRKLRLDVIAMEDYVAREERPLEVCRKDVAQSDLYIGIIAHRYGYIPPDDNPDCKSITELEYEQAGTCGITRLIFLLDDKAHWPPPQMDTHTGDNEQGARVNNLRERLSSEHTPKPFTSRSDLIPEVQAAVVAWLQDSGRLTAHPRPEHVDWPEGKSPYPGLLWFNENYAPLFFGRDKEIEDVIAKMHRPEGGFLIVSGASGSGKSSLIAAGIRRALDDDAINVSSQWEWLRIVPGDSDAPFTALAWGLRQAFPHVTTRPEKLSKQLAGESGQLSALMEQQTKNN